MTKTWQWYRWRTRLYLRKGWRTRGNRAQRMTVRDVNYATMACRRKGLFPWVTR